MRHGKYRCVMKRLGDRFLEQCVRAGVNVRRGFVEDQYTIPPQNGAREAEELSLSDAEVRPTFSHDGVEAVMQSLHSVRHVHVIKRLVDPLGAEALERIKVISDGHSTVEHRLLRYD